MAKTIEELKKELGVRERQLATLVKRRNALLKRLAVVDREISRLTGETTSAGKTSKKKKSAKRAKSARKAKSTRKRRARKTLAEVMVKVLTKSEEPMRVKDIAAAARKAGYRSASKDFYGIVAMTIRDESRFQRVGRGLYKLA